MALVAFVPALILLFSVEVQSLRMNQHQLFELIKLVPRTDDHTPVAVLPKRPFPVQVAPAQVVAPRVAPKMVSPSKLRSASSTAFQRPFVPTGHDDPQLPKLVESPATKDDFFAEQKPQKFKFFLVPELEKVCSPFVDYVQDLTVYNQMTLNGKPGIWKSEMKPTVVVPRLPPKKVNAPKGFLKLPVIPSISVLNENLPFGTERFVVQKRHRHRSRRRKFMSRRKFISRMMIRV